MRRVPIVAIVGCLLAGAAWGDTATLWSGGLWSAYGGTAQDQRAVCGIATSGAGGRRIAVQQYAGQTELEVLLDKPSWSIPPGTPIPLAVQFDGSIEPTRDAEGSGSQVLLRLPFERSISFMRQLRSGTQLRVYFPNGTEAPWTGGLAGSSGAIDAFNACRAAATPTQPYQNTPNTQPFRP